MRSADPEQFTFAHGLGAPTTLPWTRCRRITFRNDRVAFLSDLEPTAVQQTPYLNVSWPLRRDRSVANASLRLGGKTYPKGLGMHSACRVTYELGDGYRQFAASARVAEPVVRSQHHDSHI
ncbi:MAG: NPCBM/NEW2 domain-containing protein, partial [Planctomycetes bacterium]|nr:NPCBM/NEW2 domain-containing protein [Planctomycetota bacterium]